MLDFIKNNKLAILLSVVLIAFLYLTQSYYKKTEQYKVEIENKLRIVKEENIKLNVEKEQLKIEFSKQLEILKKKNKKTNIKIIENKDGSKTKEISIDENSEDSSKQKEDNKIEQNKDKMQLDENKKEDIKQDVKINEEVKKEEVKKSSTNSVLLVIGGIVACVLTHICTF